MNESFFDLIRPHFSGKLSQSQVDGINLIIAGWALYGDGNTNKLSDCLATVKLETGGAMVPVYERGPVSYFDKYEPGSAIGANLGNTRKGDGYKYRGRGLVQVTGRRNYQYWSNRLKVDLLGKPDLALQDDIAVRILIEGMLLGSFTGKGLAAYIDDVDESDDEDLQEYIEARRVVNGKDKAEEIGKSALLFEYALRTAGTPSTPKNIEVAIEKKKPSIFDWFNRLGTPKEKKVTDEAKPNWLSGLATSTLFQYIIAFVGGAVAAKLGLDPELFKHGVPDVVKEIATIVGSIAAILAAVKGMHAAATPKAVVDGTVVPLKDMPVADQKAVAAIVKKNK